MRGSNSRAAFRRRPPWRSGGLGRGRERRGEELEVAGECPEIGGIGKTGERVLGGDLRQIHGGVHHTAEALFGEVGGVGGSGARSEESADAGAAGAGFLEGLDGAEADFDFKFVALGDGDFGVGDAAVLGIAEGLAGEGFEFLAHRVPPTVMRSILMVGMPTPTGTLWPSLPQTPMPSSSLRSLPTMLTCFRASGPLPIRVAPRTGRVSLPSSMR